MIQIIGLKKSYGDAVALKGVGMDVAPGEVHGFIGANGAGKTTALKCIVGLLQPDQGSIHIGEVDALKRPIEAKRRFGFLPESHYLYPELTADEYIRFIARLRGVPDADAKAHADRFLRAFGLEEARHSYIGGYSMGMKKKTALAGCLVGDPPLIILDEPTNGLDPPSVVLFKEIIRELRKRGRTVLVASHNLPFLEDLADRFTMIDQGAVVAAGPLEALRAAAGTPGATLEDLFIHLTGRKITGVENLFA